MTKELIEAPAITEAPPAPIINAEGQRIKTELICKADVIQQITTTHIRDGAVTVAGDIKGHLTAIEKTRKEIKEPFLRMGQAIDDCAKKHVAELTVELNRLNRLVGAFNEQQRLIAQREEAKRIQAALDLQRQAEEAQRKADAEAERLRKEQEALALKQKQAQERAEAKGKELTAEQRAKQLQAQLDAQDAQELAEWNVKERQRQLDEQMVKLEQEQLEAAERMRQEKATGGAQRYPLTVEVTDAKALYVAYPNFVKLTGDLVAIKYFINNHADPNVKLPGVIWSRHAEFSAKGR